MISVTQVLEIHDIAARKFGGSLGVRDMGGLESALARSFQRSVVLTYILTSFQKPQR